MEEQDEEQDKQEAYAVTKQQLPCVECGKRKMIYLFHEILSDENLIQYFQCESCGYIMCLKVRLIVT